MYRKDFPMNIGDYVKTPSSIGIIYDIFVSERTGKVIVYVMSVKNVFKLQSCDPLQPEMLIPAKEDDLATELERCIKERSDIASDLIKYADEMTSTTFFMHEREAKKKAEAPQGT